MRGSGRGRFYKPLEDTKLFSITCRIFSETPRIIKTRIQSILIIITLLFPGLLLKLQAVIPAPDGCYPNFTTAEGCDALNLLTTGAGNTGLGRRSLFLDATGNFNTAVGGGALALNNADSNSAVGAAALLLNTTGHREHGRWN